MRSLSVKVTAVLAGALLVGVPNRTLAQGAYTTNGTEYAIAGTLAGDQVRPAIGLGAGGGYLVWEDNLTDGDGLGVSALRLDNSFSAPFAHFRVNATATGDQEHPQVALLNGGGAAFSWQGGKVGRQHIYARFLSASNTWTSANDILVNTATNVFQIAPSIATLTNGNVIVVYASLNQQSTNSLQDVYGQILSPSGQRIGSEFLVNQFTSFNQRAPAVAALAGGGFVVTWISEMQRAGSDSSPSYSFVYQPTNMPSVDIYARLFTAGGTPAGGEFLVNNSYDICGNPQLASGSDGGFMIAWSQKNARIPQYSWDVFARPYSSGAVGGNIVTVNTRLYGDQYLPQISALGTDYLIVWTSLGQDGSREGVFAQFLRGNGAPAGSEFQVNTTTASQQMHPAIASDSYGRFLVAWTSFVGGAGSFDLYAQRYINVAQPLQAMDAPFVHSPFVVSNGAYLPRLQVSWPLQSGLPIDHYEVYVDGSPAPAATLTTNSWTLSGILPNTTHTFQVAYVVIDGRRSPLSPAASGATWQGLVYGGALPVEWVAQYYGWGNPWPSANAPLAPQGPTLAQVFLSGGNPLDASTWLQVHMGNSPMGYFISWNPQPGLTYQVQTSTNLSGWSNLGPARFASGSSDSVYVGVSNAGYYRVLLMR
jgi:hypothetical protein